MEILSSGSFINLENQEKIEQLKSTAVQLANAAMETEGFVNDEESGRHLALEFWQGLEYMCRETEEAVIKNIFLNHFLDRLREIRPAQTAAVIELPQNSALKSDLAANENVTKPEDEFLGVIDTNADEEISIEKNQSAFEEDSNQTEEISTSETLPDQEVEVKTTENVSTETVEETASSASEIEEKVEPSPDNTAEAKTSLGNLSLPEKEPYQFGKCTVTATIQLLPEDDGGGVTTRRAVLSVRTHDFAPQISMVELTAGNNLTAELMPELEKVLAKYKTDLPAKVMDKLRKEKTSAKKTAPKTATETKTVSKEASKPKESVKSETSPSEAVQADAPAVPSAAQTGQQGSLFGF
jgi:hypothetical protein